MATSQLGLLSSTGSLAAPAGFLAWNWAFAYLALSSRTPKQYFGIDHNGNPRQDLAQHGEAAVREGKMTRAQLDMIQRMEAATANSIDGYTFFAASVLFALVAKVPRPALLKACTTYTVARLVYGVVYTFVAGGPWSQLRGVAWWTGNCSCMYLLWKGAQSSL